MAFTSSAVWQVQTDGSDTLGGGGFDAGVAGFPTDGAATLATSSAPVFTSASYTFVAGDVGAYIYIKSGTNWTSGWYPIASVSGGAATLNAVVGAAVLGTNNGLNTVAGCATTASPTAATWGIDYSQSASSRLTFTDMVIAATTTNFTSAANPVGKNFVGNIISNTSGTGWTVQRVAVVSTSGTTATCDKALGTAASTGGNGRMGGALASPGKAGGLVVSANTAYIKAGTYSQTSVTADVASGGFTGAGAPIFVGYSTQRYRFNSDSKPLLQISAGLSSATMTATSGTIYNIAFDGNLQTAARPTSSPSATFLKCSFTGFTTTGGGALFVLCSATGNTATIFFAGKCIGCEAYANSATPFTGGPLSYCLSYNNTGASTNGFAPNAPTILIGCVAYGNGSAGFSLSSGVLTLVNCHAEANTGAGYSNGSVGSTLISCGAFSNTGGRLSNTNGPDVNPVDLSSTAFTAAGSSDFSLTNTSGGGALLRATGALGLFPLGLTRGYLDIGAVQHADPASISVPLSRMFAGF